MDERLAEKIAKLNQMDAEIEKGLPIGVIGVSHDVNVLVKIAPHKYFMYDLQTKKSEWKITPYNLAYHAYNHLKKNNITLTQAQTDEVMNAAKAAESEYEKAIKEFFER